MSKKNTRFYLIFTSYMIVMVAIIILLQQGIQHGVFFEPGDFLHHENFALILVFFALGILTSVFVIFGFKHKKGSKKK